MKVRDVGGSTHWLLLGELALSGWPQGPRDHLLSFLSALADCSCLPLSNSVKCFHHWTQETFYPAAVFLKALLAPDP